MKPVKFSGKLQNFMKRYPEMSRVWDIKVRDEVATITHDDGTTIILERGEHWVLEDGAIIKAPD